RGVQADRKDAKNVIRDSSARAVHGAGRFTLLPALPAPWALGAGLPARGVQADRKDAKNVIRDSSARAVRGAGRFTPLPALPTPQALDAYVPAP
ncbi:MAG: hypothetical protein E7H57_19015, partial [Pantoea sp.]|nr:hypothetical protein [Pantoea sp.]